MTTAQRRAAYDEYLRSPRWQTLRREALNRASNRCQVCNGKRRLEVHHRTYARFGHESLDDLTVLCRDCHDLYHTPKAKPNVQETVAVEILRSWLADVPYPSSGLTTGGIANEVGLPKATVRAALTHLSDAGAVLRASRNRWYPVEGRYQDPLERRLR